MPVTEVLYGVPGVGKSTLARALAGRLGVQQVELDDLRPELALTTRPGEAVLDYTTEAWRRFGPLSRRTAVAGLLAVRSTCAAAVDSALAMRQEAGFVAESAFVDPAAVSARGWRARLITLPDSRQHYERFFVHRSRSAAADDQFTAARYLQDHLNQEATGLEIDVIENDAPQQLVVTRAMKIDPSAATRTRPPRP